MEVWHISDYINAVIAVATTGYLVATVVLIRLMARANSIAMTEAGQNAKFASEALVETRHSNELTRESLKLASESATIAKRTFDSQLLDKYLPVQAAVAAAAGNIRARRVLKEKASRTVVPDDFTQAVMAAAVIGGSLQNTLRLALITMERADQLVNTVTTMSAEQNDAVVQGFRELLDLHLDTAEQILVATYTELEDVVAQLRESTGRRDLTLKNLNVSGLDKSGAA